MNIIILLGCNGGANKQDSLQLQNQMVSLSSIGVIPIVDDNRHEIYLRLHNDDNQSVANITLVTSGDKPEQQFLADLSSCRNLAAKSSCQLTITLPKNLEPGSQLLRLMVTMADQHRYSVVQLLHYNKLVAVNSLLLGGAPSQIVKRPGQQASITIPFSSVIDLSYLQLSGSSNKIICEDGTNVIRAGKLCSALIELTDQPLKQELTLSSVTSDGMKLSARIMLNTTLNNIANLIVGVANSMLTPTESIGTVTLMNSGTQTASNINFFAANPLQISDNNCGNQLASGLTCTFNVRNTSSSSGQNTISINYDDGSGVNNSASLSLGYSANSRSPNLQISVSNSLLNTFVGSQQTIILTLANAGNVTLTNLMLPNLAKISSSLQYTTSGIASPLCATDGSQNLLAESSCNIGIVYTPSAIDQPTSFDFNPLASFSDNFANQISYSSSYQSISYSSLLVNQVYAASAKGLVFNESSTTLPGSVAVSPDNSSVTAESIINGVIYVGTANGNVYAYDTRVSSLAWNLVGDAALGVATISALVNLGNTLYAATSQGVWQISLSGTNNSWYQYNAEIYTYNVSALLVLNNQIYAAANNTVYVTADSGLTWNPLGSNNPGSISSMTAYGNTLLVAPTATTSVKYYDLNSSTSWAVLSGNFNTLSTSLGGVNNLQVKDNYAYVANGGKVYRYDMSKGYLGDSWAALNNALNICTTVYTLAVISNNLYAGCANGNIYWSNIQTINNGWVSIGNPTSNGNSAINALISQNNNLYAVSTDKNLYSYSLVESSPSWQKLGATVDPNGIYSLTVFGSQIIAGGGNSTVHSYDTSISGASWTVLGSASFNSGHIIYALNVSGSKIYTALGQGTLAYVYQYDTSSATPAWQAVSGGSVASISVYNLVIIGNQLYAGSYVGDIRTYNTITGGSSWSNLSSQPDGSSVYALIKESSVLYSGTQNGGVFKYDTSLGAPSWVRLCQANVPNSSPIWALTYYANKLYAGTNAGMVYVCNLSQSNPSWQVSNELSNYAPPADGSTRVNSLLGF
ncbi:MAG: hypothetical protein EKK54_11985 [Neisseriaceae bacterium]|nr:MAG: hypothetical protein EKK54_11985 [Neisseriaceae bacterium]